MTANTEGVSVSYHADGPFDTARPAVNVKVRGQSFTPYEFRRVPGAFTHGRIGSARMADLVDRAYDIVQQGFWADAAHKAEALGLGPITQEGRSGGWLVLTDGRDPQDPETLSYYDDVDPDDGAAQSDARAMAVKAWLAAYRQLSAWCAEQVASAPARVAALAQQLAMDELGAEPARRMWATWQVDPAHNPGYIMVAGADYPQKAWTV